MLLNIDDFRKSSLISLWLLPGLTLFFGAFWCNFIGWLTALGIDASAALHQSKTKPCPSSKNMLLDRAKIRGGQLLGGWIGSAAQL